MILFPIYIQVPKRKEGNRMKKKLLIVSIAGVLVLLLVVGFQIMKLYGSNDKADTNLPVEKQRQEETKKKVEKNTTVSENTVDKAEIEAKMKQAASNATLQAKKERQALKNEMTTFIKAYYTFTSETAEKDFDKAATYMTGDAKAKYQPQIDENYEGGSGSYKQYVEDVELYMDVEDDSGSFMAIVICHGDTSSIGSSSFPLIVKGQIVKEDTWKVEKVQDGNPSNFPDQFFYE